MKRLQLLGLMLMAVFALGSAVVATASASERGVLTLKEEPRVLALGENLANIGKLTVGGNTVECKKVWLLHLEMEPSNTGKTHFNLTNKDFDIHFSECKEPKAGANCSTPGDEAGVILILTLIHFLNVLDKAAGKLVPGFGALILNAKLENLAMTIKCGILAIEVKGEPMGLVEPLNEKNEITLTEEVKKFGLIARPKVICDKENEKVCDELLEKEQFLASVGKGFVAAEEETQLEPMTLNTDVLWDD